MNSHVVYNVHKKKRREQEQSGLHLLHTTSSQTTAVRYRIAKINNWTIRSKYSRDDVSLEIISDNYRRQSRDTGRP
eukprot:764543-Hanusia_phi.AAC.1